MWNYGGEKQSKKRRRKCITMCNSKMGNEISNNLKRHKLILLVTWRNKLLMTQHMLNKIKIFEEHRYSMLGDMVTS